MKKFILLLFCPLYLLCPLYFQLNAQEISHQNDSIKQWTPEWRKKFLSDRENPEKWDSPHYIEDLQNISQHKHSPLSIGVFPVPNYNLYPGTFDGVFAANFDIPLSTGNRIACLINGNSKTTLNSSLIGDNDTDFFFILAVVTDMPQDTISYDDVNVEAISRNHPDVISQGYVRISPNDKVDYVSFRAANNDAYAVVNMRLFNLNDGNIVIIVPQEDGSLRSMQINPDELLTFQTLRLNLTTLFTENEAIKRFLNTRQDEFSQLNHLQ
ncbi:MAG: hypothetical protein K2N05_10055 [Muribaculaceae bacterium]|nr:hypothetical protein [Muribaculaceae bacterium]